MCVCWLVVAMQDICTLDGRAKHQGRTGWRLLRCASLFCAVYKFRFFNDGRWLSHKITSQAFVGALYIGVARNVELALKLPGTCTSYLNGFKCLTAELRILFVSCRASSIYNKTCSMVHRPWCMDYGRSVKNHRTYSKS